LLPRHQEIGVTLSATLFAMLAALVIRHRCVGKREPYALDEPDPNVRPSSDDTNAHVVVLFIAGALAGSTSGALCFCKDGPLLGALGGTACAAVFVPVALAVIAAARRAQRARLGTVVANMDRRAVWSILAAALGVTTLEALPDRGAILIALVAALVVFVVAWADERARSLAFSALVDLTASNEEISVAPIAIDLGLGEELGAHVKRSQVAYRDRDRVIDLVRGDPVVVRAAMGRARLRTMASIAILACVGVTHAIAAVML
jgi:hypothetical protein